MSEGVCDLCKGIGSFANKLCSFCNGTGEWNQAAQAYVKNHICQCIVWDRKFCPVCMLKCHHSSSQNDKQTIDPGWGGINGSFTVTKDEGNNKEEEIIA